MNTGHDEFFAIFGEGAALLKNLDEQSSGFFDDLNRLREILAMLGYESAVKPLAFSLGDKEGSLKALSDYLNNGMKLLPKELAPFELLTMYDLTILAGGNTSPLSGALWEYGNTLGVAAGDPEAKLAAFTALAGRGVKHGIEQVALTQAIADADELLAKRLDNDPEYAKMRARYEEISASAWDGIKRLDGQIRDSVAAYNAAREAGISLDDLRSAGDEIRRMEGELTELYKANKQAQWDAWELVKQATDKFNEGRASSHRALFEANGQAIIDKIAEASPITSEQAQAWAAEQIIDANAKAKLRKLGYKPEDVVRDMAEFYRLTGGKASAIRIGIDGGKRANAVGITERLGEKVINLGSRFNKTVLFHELAHHLENDPIAKAAANGFLLKRREGDGVHSLRAMTGLNYDKREVAYKDHFMDAYVGKYYKDGITEVWSMGVQYLANPKDAAVFAAKDPEMFALISGYLSMPLTPAMHAKLNMHKGAIGEMQEKKQSEEEQYEKAVQFLAEQAPITKDNWFDTLDKVSEAYYYLNTYVLARVRKDRAQYVGSNGNYRVFSGVFRNGVTMRNAKGYVVVDSSTGGAGSGMSMDIPDYEIVHGGLEVVQAVIALAQRDGTGLSKAVRGYFRDNWVADRKKKLIETVGVENLQ